MADLVDRGPRRSAPAPVARSPPRLLAEAGRTVTVVEEGPWIDPDALEPFSLEEMVAQVPPPGAARPRSATRSSPTSRAAASAAAPRSTAASTTGCPTTWPTSGSGRYRIDEFTPEALAGYADRVEDQISVARVPGRAAGVVGRPRAGRHQARLAQRGVRPGVQLRRPRARGTKQTMSRTMLPRALAAGATIVPDCRVLGLAAPGRPHRRRPLPADATRAAASSG